MSFTDIAPFGGVDAAEREVGPQFWPEVTGGVEEVSVDVDDH